MARRQYTESQKAEALAALDANGGDLSKTARDTGVPRATLQEWRAGRGVNGAVTEVRQEKARDLAAELEKLAFKLVRHCGLKTTLNDSSLSQAATALGIAVDKLQNLRGVSVGDGGTNPVIVIPDNGRSARH